MFQGIFYFYLNYSTGGGHQDLLCGERGAVRQDRPEAGALEAHDRVGGGPEGPEPTEESQGHTAARRRTRQEEDQQGKENFQFAGHFISFYFSISNSMELDFILELQWYLLR